MLYPWICSSNILGAEGRGAEGRGPRIRAEGRGTQTPPCYSCSYFSSLLEVNSFLIGWQKELNIDVSQSFLLTVDNKVILKEVRIHPIVNIPAHLNDLTI